MLCEEVRALGGRAYKLTSPGCAGMPDRIVCLPNGDVFFIELKTAKGRLSKLQKARIAELKAMQQNVLVLYDENDVLHFIDNARELMNGAF